MVKNLLAVQEIRVQLLGWEDPLEEEMAIHPSILAWRIVENPHRSLVGYSSWGTVHGLAKGRTRHNLVTEHSLTHLPGCKSSEVRDVLMSFSTYKLVYLLNKCLTGWLGVWINE